MPPQRHTTRTSPRACAPTSQLTPSRQMVSKWNIERALDLPGFESGWDQQPTLGSVLKTKSSTRRHGEGQRFAEKGQNPIIGQTPPKRLNREYALAGARMTYNRRPASFQSAHRPAIEGRTERRLKGHPRMRGWGPQAQAGPNWGIRAHSRSLRFQGAFSFVAQSGR